MKLLFFCPLGHRLAVPQSRAGKRGRCPICAQLLIIPRVGISAETYYPAPPPPPAGPVAQLAPFDLTELAAADDSPSVLDADFAALQQAGIEQGAGQPSGQQPTGNRAGLARPVDLDDSTLAALETMIADHRLTAVATPTVVVRQQSLTVSFDEPAGQAEEILPPRAAGERPRRAITTSVERRDQPRPRLASICEPAVVQQAFQNTSDARQAAIALGAALIVLALLGLSPLARVDSLVTLPAWAQGLALLGTLQLASAGWLLMMPDWLTARLCMLVQAVAATTHGVLMVVLLGMNRGELPPGLDSIRGSAPAWCASQVLLLLIGTLACLKLSAWWQTMPLRVARR